MAQIRIRYAVCAIPRVGSSYLCELLQNNGLGRPGEHFHVPIETPDNPTEEALLEHRHRVEARNTINGIMGTKLCATDWFRWRERYPATHLIRIRRMNLIEQAISHYIATYTNRWAAVSSQPVPDKPVPFNADMIAFYYQQIRQQTQLWDQELATRSHLTIQYETLCDDPEGTLRQIFDYLGLPHPAAFHLTTRRQKQRDDTQVQDWIARLQQCPTFTADLP